MARTLVGRLQLIVQAMGLGEAKKVTDSISSIEKAARRLADSPWGANFQRQLDKLGASAREMDQVRRAWENLHRDMNRRGLSAALQKSEISAWKTATLGHFASIRAGFRETEMRARQHARLMRDILRPAYVALGGYTGLYMTGMLGREALSASSEREREKFRQEMAAIPSNERASIYSKSADLGQRYPSVNVTDIMEMARVARNTMGTTERGMEVLDRMVQGFVTLQSVKGVEAAASELSGLLRGLDNLGKNSNGQLGIDTVNSLIDAFIRAAQIEGNDFDVGSMWAFARRSRIGGPALSSEFLATVAPAMIQDMGPDGAGTALNMAYKAFVIGANDGASKVNLGEQRRLGLRVGEGGAQGYGHLIDGDLFGTNPYEWVKRYLVPALKEDGVDTTNDVAVSKAVAQLSRNSSATGFLTRMITQMEQFERLISLYNRGMGTEAADRAAGADPFIAWKGFQESLRNLSAAVGETVMPVIVPALNSLSSTINEFAAMVQGADPRVMVGAGVAGGALALWGTAKVLGGIWGLITAGAALHSAAAALTAAAVAGGGGGIGAGTAATGGGIAGAASRWGGRLAAGAVGIWGALVQSLGDTPGDTFEDQVANQRKAREALRGALGLDKPALPDTINGRDRGDVERDASLDTFLKGPEQGTGVIGDMLSGMEKLSQTTATPNVDSTSLDAFLQKVNNAIAALNRLSSAASSANSSIDTQLERSYSDYGVVP